MTIEKLGLLPLNTVFSCVQSLTSHVPTFLLIAFTCCCRSVPCNCCYIHLFYNPSLLELKKIYLAVGETIDIQLTNHWVVPPETVEKFVIPLLVKQYILYWCSKIVQRRELFIPNWYQWWASPENLSNAIALSALKSKTLKLTNWDILLKSEATRIRIESEARC